MYIINNDIINGEINYAACRKLRKYMEKYKWSKKRKEKYLANYLFNCTEKKDRFHFVVVYKAQQQYQILKMLIIDKPLNKKETSGLVDNICKTIHEMGNALRELNKSFE